jgi:seryl-tRNA synthetase
VRVGIDDDGPPRIEKGGDYPARRFFFPPFMPEANLPAMLDPNFIRKNTDLVRKGLADKGESGESLEWFIQRDKEWRAAQKEQNDIEQERNALSKVIGGKKQKGEDAGVEMAKVTELNVKYKAVSERSDALKEDLRTLLMRMPNLAAADVPVGDATANRVEATWGDEPKFDFAPKPHWELGAALKTLDSEAAAKLSGSGFSVMSGGFAQLERALINYMLDLHTREHGYVEVNVPYMVKQHCLEGCGQLPKFEDEMYRCRDDDLYLIPTAEVPLTNIHREKILAEADLPIRYCAFSPCFRREAGAAGKDTRGLIRMHQFHKVELMAYTTPEASDAELLRIRTNAETVLRNLKLRHRAVLLSTGDMSFGSRKTFDLELWAPGVGAWLEVSSVSTFGDFQARRAGIRYRNEKTKKVEFAHTLNGSGVALPRLLIALIETYQRADGSIAIPDVLRPYMGWKPEIR